MNDNTLPLLPITECGAPTLPKSVGPQLAVGSPPFEHEHLAECEVRIRNIGWTLGNDCPYRCTHCYSLTARTKGANLSEWMVERVVDQLTLNGIETVNLGGNEPLYTNGLDPRQSLLPLIVRRLADRGILVGLTTAGISLLYLEQHHPDTVALLNDIDISFDSPFEHEHNANRGASLFNMAERSLEIAQTRGIPHTVIMCGMSWNFSPAHIRALVDLAGRYGAHVRINPIKPVEESHMSAELSPSDYYAGFRLLMELCDSVDLGEPPLAALAQTPDAKGCPCGRSSFRIHSITPDGAIPVSPCVYLHDYKIGDLLVDDLHDIVRSPPFRAFRRRNGNPQAVDGCEGCNLLESCRGGCAARAYLTHLHRTSAQTLFARDPYCPRDEYIGDPLPAQLPTLSTTRLVHQDYLCTWIGKPKGEHL